MSVEGIDQVLAQMRSMAAQAAGGNAGADAARPAEAASFSQLLKQSVDSVNETQQIAAEMKTAFELGEKDVNLAEVMVAVQKSSISFQAMVQVRNKLVDAYKEVMSMPI